MWKLVNLIPAGPPKPHIGPPDPPDGPGRPKMAQITIIQSSGDSLWQKINFGGGQFFFVFSLGQTQVCLSLIKSNPSAWPLHWLTRDQWPALTKRHLAAGRSDTSRLAGTGEVFCEQKLSSLASSQYNTFYILWYCILLSFMEQNKYNLFL